MAKTSKIIVITGNSEVVNNMSLARLIEDEVRKVMEVTSVSVSELDYNVHYGK